MEPDAEVEETASKAGTGSRSRDRFVSNYLNTLPSPFVEGKVLRPPKKGQHWKRLSESKSGDDDSGSDHPDVPEVLSEDEEWLCSKGQRRRFMASLCSDLPTIDEEVSYLSNWIGW